MENGLMSMAFQSLLGLTAVLGLFALMVWGMRRFQIKTNAIQQDFKVIQKIHIDSKNSIVEIYYRGQHYLLGVSASGLTQLRTEHCLPAQASSPNTANNTKTEET